MQNSQTETYLEQIQRTARYESLRPMSVSEIVDFSLKLFRVVGGAIMMPILAAASMVFISVVMISQMLIPQLFVTSRPDSVSAQVFEVSIAIVLGLVAALPTFIIGLGSIASRSIIAAKDYLLGLKSHEVIRTQEVDLIVPRMMRLIVRMVAISSSGVIFGVVLLMLAVVFGTVLKASSIGPLVTTLGTTCLFGSGFWFIRSGLRHCLAPAVLVMENTQPKEALARSAFLTKSQRYIPGSTDTVMAMLFILLVFTGILSGTVSYFYSFTGIIEFLTGLTSGYWWSEILIPTVLGIPFLVTLWLVLPAWYIGMTTIYFERRIRIEGFDVEMLNHELASKNRR